LTKNENYRLHMQTINESYPNRTALSITEVAAAIGVSAKTIRRRIAEGTLQATKQGRMFFITKVNLLKYIGGIV
jgi:excisionase family DNA binding protein